MSENGDEDDMRKYIPMIDAILEVSDLDSVSIKRIRKALECLYNINLEFLKKEIAAVIMERYYILIDNREKHKAEENEAQEKSKKEENKEETLLKELDKKLNTKKRSKGRANEGKQQQKKRKTGHAEKKTKGQEDGSKTKRNTGFHAPCVLIGPLATFLDETVLPRTEVVKRMWNYIKENNLQNENDRREILCDDKLKPIFGDKMTMFSMNKLLSKFIKKQDELS